MPFWKCYFHIVWATKHRQPIITPAMEPLIYRVVTAKAQDLGCRVLGINGVEDHIHLALMIPPGVLPAEVIGQAKGTSSYEVNVATNSDERFRWQTGYGILTFGVTNLPFVLDYIAHQKEHHASGKIEHYLEKSDDD